MKKRLKAVAAVLLISLVIAVAVLSIGFIRWPVQHRLGTDEAMMILFCDNFHYHLWTADYACLC